MTYNFTLANWSNNTDVGAKAWTDPGNAEFLDAEYATLAGLASESNYLYGTGPSVLGSSFAVGEFLSSITINIFRFTSGEIGDTTDAALYLIDSSGILTAIDFASASLWPASTQEASYLVSAAELSTLGITKASLTSAFGICLSISNSSGVETASVDQIAGVFTTEMFAPQQRWVQNQPGYVPNYPVRSF